MIIWEVDCIYIILMLCGNTVIGQFIHEKDLKWIPYCGFENIKYLDKGGFGIVYKATWLENKKEVVLKCLNQLKSNMDLDEFLNEWKYHCQVINSNAIINVYGITKDPDTSKHMVVMDYANEGNLRGSLTKIIKSNWNEKLHILYEIICGLDEIHKKKLIHCDFHDGNILNHTDETSKFYVSDLGLSQPVKSFLKKENDNIYGVMPFMAPEVLRGEPYTPASDIYSFSMIMWEFTSGVTPFNDRAHDLQLSLSICTGERPEIIKSTPQCYVDLMEKCWDENPLERPSSSDVSYVIKGWICRYSYSVKSEKLRGNIMEFISAPIERKFNTKSHPQAYNISHSFDFTSSELNNKLSECLECQIVD
ncbi:hypothetical protein RclHR1_02090016 [Rhizophagus clarus]|uniref:Protein kinase domain-containing protein n=1 Tax=Rhizophagus clarus TaxID=94130 RepID=A0A2Z6QWP5_9GLOM|nr:hypothetical protein RclHR1_02090016 [Rhizophagus clarus]